MCVTLVDDWTCIDEFGPHDNHEDCAATFAEMSGSDFDFTSYDYPEYDPQTDHYERFGRPAFPNEY